MHAVEWYVGCSGFHYKEWKEEFYPKELPPSQWFEFYAQHFNTLELNVTFYRFPQLKSLQNWYAKSPENFVFSAKVPRTVTHYKRFVETQELITKFYQTLKEGLAEKLGAVLFQLPPQFSFTDERLELLLSQLDESFTNVIEFRHESWWRKEVMDVLQQKNISFSGVSFPKIAHDEAVITSPVAYYRFHGVPQLFYSEYNEAFLKKIVKQIAGDPQVKKAFLYFNNTASVAALHNAKFVQQQLKKKKKS